MAEIKEQDAKLLSGSILTDFDMQLIGEGNFFKSYEKFGAHIIERDGVKGVNFLLWAPNADWVAVIGDFNSWDKTKHLMHKHESQGVWELFIPGIGAGEKYKYGIQSHFNGFYVQKCDPYGFFSEMRPKTASIVFELDKYEWQDQEWVNEGRAKHNNIYKPVSIYELHLGSWRRRWNSSSHDESYLTYRELADQVVEYITEMGFTHIEIMPITEHPFDGSWGYQTTGYYAVTSRFGDPYDFMYLVDKCHQHNIGVILDWVPAHFPKDSIGLGYFDGTHLYEHSDPRQGEHTEWGTLIFNYGRNEVRNFLLSNALFWLGKYHIDGLRVDAVASMLYLDYARNPGEWIPNRYGGRENLEAIDFIKRFNERVHLEFPNTLTCAEESTDWPMVSWPTYAGGLGFDLKWNMGWMHDMLEYMKNEPIYRRYHHNSLTFSLMYAFSENFILPLSHDEVVHLKRSLLDKMPGDMWQKFANLRAFYGYMFTHPGKKLLFMGGEFGQWKEWNEREALQWELLQYDTHSGLSKFMKDLLHLYRNEPALYEVDTSWEGFQWLESSDVDNSTIAFLRRAKDHNDELIIACNLTPVPRQGHRIGVPKPGYYQEILNSDSESYWGSNMGNGGGLDSENVAWGGHYHSVKLTLPPLSTIILRSPRP
ncbi:MAG: 1,4-alpha-glucan branching protein GlgB [Chloroflexi bacterium]|uniref:1,4-alpha-glucan branching enzyme GlgB n=1 Tax=Candidatus Chlorohelix allophototropha TaxID=3003348 RepID=A0A8T7LXL5_9CHLR|nr:1,4-alpha-glucan branching protein GlgB [Chloroflexota bacterium]WJW66079.1 1,4-alpha-glucan branching protein GlgB [Chloroflexota bacterium L227-S17]